MGALALFLVLTGGVAYAANTVFSTDIVNNQVYSADVRNDALGNGGLAARRPQGRLGEIFEVGADSLLGGDIDESNCSSSPGSPSRVVSDVRSKRRRVSTPTRTVFGE